MPEFEFVTERTTRQTPEYMPDIGCQKLDQNRCHIEYLIPKDIIVTELRVKTSFWKLVPWVICGAASTDPEVARRCMKEALQQYDHAVDHGMDSGDSQPNISHPITRRFLAKDPAIV